MSSFGTSRSYCLAALWLRSWVARRRSAGVHSTEVLYSLSFEISLFCQQQHSSATTNKERSPVCHLIKQAPGSFALSNALIHLATLATVPFLPRLGKPDAVSCLNGFHFAPIEYKESNKKTIGKVMGFHLPSCLKTCRDYFMS